MSSREIGFRCLCPRLPEWGGVAGYSGFDASFILSSGNCGESAGPASRANGAQPGQDGTDPWRTESGKATTVEGWSSPAVLRIPVLRMPFPLMLFPSSASFGACLPKDEQVAAKIGVRCHTLVCTQRTRSWYIEQCRTGPRQGGGEPWRRWPRTTVGRPASWPLGKNA